MKKKRTKWFTFNSPLTGLMLVICFLITLIFPQISIAAKFFRPILFYNNEGEDADDLHIEFSAGVTVTDPGPFSVRPGSEGLGQQNLYGATVENGQGVVIEVESDWDITINTWWWTKNGNAIRVGDIVGTKKTDDDGR